eukprot:2553702-Amphidinium_carterae.1
MPSEFFLVLKTVALSHEWTPSETIQGTLLSIQSTGKPSTRGEGSTVLGFLKIARLLRESLFSFPTRHGDVSETDLLRVPSILATAQVVHYIGVHCSWLAQGLSMSKALKRLKQGNNDVNDMKLIHREGKTRTMKWIHREGDE